MITWLWIAASLLVLLVAWGAVIVIADASRGAGSDRPAGRPVPAPRRGRPAPSPRPRLAASSTHNRPERTMNANFPSSADAPARNRQELDARKTIHAFDFILRSFGRTPPWTSPAQREDFIHDIAVMLRHRDLDRASVELLGSDRSLLYRHRIVFGQRGGADGPDAAGGIELPLLPAEQVAAHRVLFGPTSRMDSYRGELRCAWRRAEQIGERNGSRFESQHTRRVNAGRMAGEVFVADTARHTVTVLNVAGQGQYAFGRAAGLPANVFLHRGQCDGPLEFQAGQRLDCVLIQTPRGLQGRNIRLANGR